MENLFESETTDRTTILSSLYDTLRDVDFLRRIVITLDIIRKICMHLVITMKKLAECEKLSERSVKRYMDILRMEGAIINYKDKGCILKWLFGITKISNIKNEGVSWYSGNKGYNPELFTDQHLTWRLHHESKNSYNHKFSQCAGKKGIKSL